MCAAVTATGPVVITLVGSAGFAALVPAFGPMYAAVVVESSANSSTPAPPMSDTPTAALATLGLLVPPAVIVTDPA